MNKVEEYRNRLRGMPLEDWPGFLRSESRLPGPRGNIELAAAVAEEASRDWLLEHAEREEADAPENTAESFLVFCGVRGLGRLLVERDETAWELLRRRASDSRWRVREAVAMALQTLGASDMGRLLRTAEVLASGGPLEQRAAAAGVAEPSLLGDRRHAKRVITLLDRITESIATATDRRTDSFRALRQGMGYCWSVVVAAYPVEGKAAFERWLESTDRDVRWIVRENLKKRRLSRMDPEWVEGCVARL